MNHKPFETEKEGFIAAIADRDNTIKLLLSRAGILANQRDERRLFADVMAAGQVEHDRLEVEYQAATLRIDNDLMVIAALTAERDAYAKAADTMAAAHKVERDALKDAARLALDALYAVLHDCDDIDMVESNEPGRDVGPWQLSNEAIVVLEAVL